MISRCETLQAASSNSHMEMMGSILRSLKEMPSPLTSTEAGHMLKPSVAVVARHSFLIKCMRSHNENWSQVDSRQTAPPSIALLYSRFWRRYVSGYQTLGRVMRCQAGNQSRTLRVKHRHLSMYRLWTTLARLHRSIWKLSYFYVGHDTLGRR